MNILGYSKAEFIHSFLFKHKIKTGKDTSLADLEKLLFSLDMLGTSLGDIGLHKINEDFVQNDKHIQLNLEDGVEFIKTFINNEYSVQSGSNYVVYQLINKINQYFKRPASVTDFKYPEHTFIHIRNLYIVGAIDWDEGLVAKKDMDYIEKLNIELERVKEKKRKLFLEMINEIETNQLGLK